LNNEKPKKRYKKWNIYEIFILICFYGFIFWIFTLGDQFFGWVGDKMDSRDSRKERCIDETYNIKNEFTAKKMYKACMKR
jgi:hypothetical protein